MSADANLSPDMRALVTVLREIRDEQKRCADALEKVATGTPPMSIFVDANDVDRAALGEALGGKWR